MTDREERQHVIKVLKQMRLDYEDFWEENDTEEIKALNYAIASIETDLKYDLLYEQESNCSEIPTGSTTKDYLGVDAVSRQAINGYIDYILSNGMGKRKSFEFIKKFVANLPSVTPQLSSGLDKNSKKLEKDFGESDCISREAVNELVSSQRLDTFSDEGRKWANIKIDVILRGLKELSSVTPQEPKWISVSEKLPNDRDWYLGIFKEPDTGWINPLPFICDYVGRETKATTKEFWILHGFTDMDEHIDYYFNLECVAWMPLPEPYKAEGSEE